MNNCHHGKNHIIQCTLHFAVCFVFHNWVLSCFSFLGLKEGFARLWRGTNASLALAVPTVRLLYVKNHAKSFLRHTCWWKFLLVVNQVGIYLPCYDILRNVMEGYTTEYMPSLTPYVPLLAGSAARSLACISCYPVELARTRMQVQFLPCLNSFFRSQCSYFIEFFFGWRVPIHYRWLPLNALSLFS